MCIESSVMTTTKADDQSQAQEDGGQKDLVENDNNNNVSYCEVLIIGAGVSGLQCARSLTIEGPLSYDNVIILEARNRIGGRVNTREYKVPSSSSSSSVNGKDDAVLYIDNGAAWAHGIDPLPWEDETVTGNDNDNDCGSGLKDVTTTTAKANGIHTVNSLKQLENPMLQYLDRKKDLIRVASGNPWTRPYSVLLKQQNIAIYVQPTSNEQERSPPKPLMFTKKNKIKTFPRKQQEVLKETNRLINASIRRHYHILRLVARQIQQMYEQGRYLEANSKLDVMSSLEHFNQEVAVFQGENSQSLLFNEHNLLALTSFYQHMLEYWQGFSLDKVPLGYFADDQGLARTRSDEESSSSSNADDDDDPLWDDADFEPDGDFGGPHCTVRGGMQKLVQRICTPELMERVQLEQEVLRIQHIENTGDKNNNNKHNVRVETKSGSVIYARACVVTIPVGCLRETHQTLFADTTPLSQEKLEAFQFIAMGKYKKVFLTFKSIFWPARPAFLGMALQQSAPNAAAAGATHTSPLGTTVLVDNLWARDGHPCMECILTGDQAVWATHKPDDVVRNVVLEFLESATGIADLKSECLDCHITRWEEDPYSRGAFSGLAMGGTDTHIEAYREPEWRGCLRFAGDASSAELEGSVHSALLSGKFSAREVLKYLSHH